MRKFTDFIVDKRYFILGFFIIASVICTILSFKVDINDDIAKYLPSTSETRIGMDIMEENFKEIDTSSLNVMFKGLENKSEVLNYLENISGVSDVDYDETEEHNKDDYTLYEITVDGKEDSKLASDVYNAIKNHFEQEEIYFSGAIHESNKELLPTWIMVVAVLCVFVILTIMCESYIEPILFLITILMAILLNSGTNIIFKSVSNITSSIAAILQLALSMDYSIMLMDRYQQKKAQEKNKTKAMKDALYEAFTAIASSSVTTIVGLLALAFMSFTIGRDLGFVLAKGVLFSLICIFFVLPSFILICDKAITKTKKHSPNIRLNRVGKISYKCRYVALIAFLIVFVASFVLKGNLNILYTDSQQDQIAKVFQEENQIVLIYKNEDEEKISNYLTELENKTYVEEVLGYGNMINKELKYNELNEKIKDLDSSIDIEDYLLKILYYKYYNQKEDNQMTFSEFTRFIQNEVLKNEDMKDQIDNETRKNIDRLENFTQKNLIHKKRNAKEIADLLEIEEDKVDDIFVYYYSKNSDKVKMSMDDFVKFMGREVLTDEEYAKNVSDKEKSSIDTLKNFTSKTTVTKKMTSKEMALLFNIPEDIMDSLYMYYVSTSEMNTKLSLNEFANFVLNEVLTRPEYASMFDESTKNSIQMLATFSDKSLITQNKNAKELANLFTIPEDLVKQVLLLKYSKVESNTKLTLQDFKDNVTFIKDSTHYLDGVDISALTNLDATILNNPTKYRAEEMASILQMDKKQMNEIYALIDFVNDTTSNWEATPYEFVTYLLASNQLDSATKPKLQLLESIMKSALNNNNYSYQDLAKFIGVDKNVTKSIYTLYTLSHTTTKLTPEAFVDFVLEHKSDKILSENLDKGTISSLQLLQKVIEGVVQNKKYTSQELSDVLEMDKSTLDLLYGLYNVKNINKNPRMSLNNFVSFVIHDVLSEPDYSSEFDHDKRTKLDTIEEIMESSLSGTKYSKDKLLKTLDKLGESIDKDTTELLYIYYGSDSEYNKNWTLTVEKLIQFLNEDILKDKRFDDFLDGEMRTSIIEAKDSITDAKELLLGNGYSRVLVNTKLPKESSDTFHFIQNVKDDLASKVDTSYVIGDSPMAYEMSKTFQGELDFITVLTMLAIFTVVAFTFKSLLVPFLLVLLIQCAVYTTMGIMSFSGEGVYFIALLIVQSILMGATIDYAILYTTYYIEYRKTMDKKESIIHSYNSSINTILTSSSILVIATFVIALFSSGIISKICKVLSEGTLCAALLILILLPAIIAACDKVVIKKNK